MLVSALLPEVTSKRLTATIDEVSGCWIFEGSRTHGGYGQIYFSGRLWNIHRLAYVLINGPIIGKMDVDHMCHNADSSCEGGKGCIHRRCFNPDHLGLKTRSQNLMASGPFLASVRSNGQRAAALGSAAAGAKAKANPKTHCPQGHVYSESNTYISPNGKNRYCRTCHRTKVNEDRAARKAA